MGTVYWDQTRVYLGTLDSTDSMWGLVLLLSPVFLTGTQGQCPDTVNNRTGVSDWSLDTGCIFADINEKERYDTYERALGLCREALGPNGRLAEILSAEDQKFTTNVIKRRRVCLSSRIPNCLTGGVGSRIVMMMGRGPCTQRSSNLHQLASLSKA